MGVDGRPDEQVYAAHAAELVRFATGLVGVHDAPDVVADAYLRVTRSAVWGDARDRRVLWLRAVVFEARSLARSSARRRARELRVAVPVAVDGDQLDAGSSEVTDALDRLSVQQRAVLVLTYWSDLDPAAVAEQLGVSEGSVRKQLARARARMKEALT